ncbi:hypothetical protein SAMN02745857_04168 [Andreprevotia lacus DSM 23236]|jgi:hypothetical protein|uniref:Putative DNA-binding domain-containing protein n=1 Tax=Andreprevotia lacus DSM 23236 TaxID=1121001 RepID=A0A1W1Y109_9NEIS|nr:putative DNA-binding domain-containing protein [Andreprevotia lacus]SMC29827.1 hypothetical protein SAMN02745857_04168 [Andreprevotia lacus DSM 23236]
MLSYAEAIADFAHALNDTDHQAQALSDASRERIAVYRNNARLNRIDALPAAFPTVAALVGDDYFRALAREYVKTTPALSANLHDDGAGLAGFIAGFAPARDLPYLADVARLDWAMHRAYYADDVAALDPQRLAALDGDGFMRGRLRLHPAVALVQSTDWPIADILAMHQGGPDAALAAGGQAVLVWRSRAGVQHTRLDDVHWLAALLAGQAVGDALALAHTDPNPVLARLFADGLICDFEDTTP